MPHWLSRFWRFLNNLGTIHFLWSIGGGAVVSVLIRQVTDLPAGWIAVLGIGTASLILAVFLTWARPRHEHEFPPELKTIVDKELESPKVSVKREGGEFAAEALHPRVTDVVLVTNESLFPIGFDSTVEGSLTFRGEAFRLPPTLTVRPDRPIRPGETARLSFEYFLTNDEMEKIEHLMHNEPLGTRGSLDFRNIKVWMILHAPGKQQRVRLPTSEWLDALTTGES